MDAWLFWCLSGWFVAFAAEVENEIVRLEVHQVRGFRDANAFRFTALLTRDNLALAANLTVCLFISGMLSGCGVGPKTAAVTLSFSSALADLTNVAAFAQTPLGKTVLISTYDRTGGNEDWAKSLKKDRDGLVTLADLKGPGCVTRLWMTSIPAKEWLFFFDGEAQPRIRMSENDFFGKKAPFLPPFNDKVSGGFYSYTPLPFNKSLRVAVAIPELKPDLRPYYQINWEQYDRNVCVETFPAQLSRTDLDLLRKAREQWLHLGDAHKATVASCPARPPVTLAPGEKTEWFRNDSAGVLNAFWIKILPSENMSPLAKAGLLRELVLKFNWDGASLPSVETPLGDFFCNGLDRAAFSSLPLSVTEDAMICRFPMPFGRSARGEIRNDGKATISIQVGYDVRELPTSEKVNYFHAAWNSASFGGRPFKLLWTQGIGYIAGCYLIAIGMDGSWNILEGDEAITVDKEAHPAYCGTGLEDYFNGAWYYGMLFDLPLHGLLEKSPIRTSQYRFNVPERVTFNNGVNFDWEFGHGNLSRGYMSSVVYWYQPEPHPCNSRIPAAGERLPQADPLEPSAITTRLINLEMAGKTSKAVDACLEYAERFRGSPFSLVVQLRAAAYQEVLTGYNSVRHFYTTVAAMTNMPYLARQAQDLIWFHESESNELIGIQSMAAFELFMDGKHLGGGKDPVTLTVFRKEMSPGAHEVAAELLNPLRDGVFSFYMKGHSTNRLTDAMWEYTRKKPTNWPVTDDPAADWKPVEEAFWSLPCMAWWQFTPTAYIDMQAGCTMLRPWQEWPSSGQAAYLRRKFIVP